LPVDAQDPLIRNESALLHQIAEAIVRLPLLSVDTIKCSPGSETVKVGLEDLDFENLVDLLCGDFRNDLKLFMSLYDPANRELGSLALH
jgi:hypothetical protein